MVNPPQARHQVEHALMRHGRPLDYLWTLATLRILGRLAGPLPETPIDRLWGRDWERIEKAFPAIER
jgi:hypothetical protein